MDYSRSELVDRLAAEYVLGTLHGPARRRFEALLPAHPRLRQATLDWQRRLAQLAEVTPPVSPSPQVWEGIQQRLFNPVAAPAQDRSPSSSLTASLVNQAAQGAVRWWQRLILWQGVAAFATVTALSLGIWMAQPHPAQPPIVVVMAGPGDAAGGVQAASFVASVSGDGRSLVLKPLAGTQAVALNKALELWALPAKGAPRSLGLVKHEGSTTVLRNHLLQGTAAFAVTVEPAGGSPTGLPTGPIISVGKLQL